MIGFRTSIFHSCGGKSDSVPVIEVKFLSVKSSFYLVIHVFHFTFFIQEQRDSEWRRGLCHYARNNLCLTPEGKEIA